MCIRDSNWNVDKAADNEYIKSYEDILTANLVFVLNGTMPYAQDDLSLIHIQMCIRDRGDTDKEKYRRIVWDGAYGREQLAD